MSYTAVRAGSNDTYKQILSANDRKIIIYIVYLVFRYTYIMLCSKESISELYAQLDRAIEQSQHYVKLKESSIAQLKELIHQEKIRSCSSIPIANLFRIQVLPERFCSGLYSEGCRTGSEGRIVG